jgi:Flp pilus assembly pilin Flp
MRITFRFLERFVRADAGVTAIEYAVIISGIALTLLVAIDLAGDGVRNTYNTIQESVVDATGGGGGGGGGDDGDDDGKGRGGDDGED